MNNLRQEPQSKGIEARDNRSSRSQRAKRFLILSAGGAGLLALSPLIAACGLSNKDAIATEQAYSTATTTVKDAQVAATVGAAQLAQARAEGAATAIASLPTATEAPTATAALPSATATETPGPIVPVTLSSSANATAIEAAATMGPIAPTVSSTRGPAGIAVATIQMAVEPTPQPTEADPEKANPYDKQLGGHEKVAVSRDMITANTFVEVQGDTAIRNSKGELIFTPDDIASTGQITVMGIEGEVESHFGGDFKSNVPCATLSDVVMGHLALMKELGGEKAAGKGAPPKTVNLILILRDGSVVRVKEQDIEARLNELSCAVVPQETATPAPTVATTPGSNPTLAEHPAGQKCDVHLGKVGEPDKLTVTNEAAFSGDVVLVYKDGTKVRTYDVGHDTLGVPSQNTAQIGRLHATADNPITVVANPEGARWQADVYNCPNPDDLAANVDQSVKNIQGNNMVLQDGKVHDYPSKP